jgi:preprotein translocase subunit SecG
MSFLSGLLMVALFLLAIFLIVLILIQRGKGGGLAGAFGGMGGQSAFGTKAGDLFTRITIGVATVWIVLCIVSIKVFSGAGERLSVGPTKPTPNKSAPADGGTPYDETQTPPAEAPEEK